MTDLTVLQKTLTERLPGVALRFFEPMAAHTSFRIGGPAEVMAFPRTREELASILAACADLSCPVRILGAGTNVLAPDAALPGVTVCLKDCFGGITRTDETHISVMAGVSMTRAANFAADCGLVGLEFAHGIPGTVGGGVYMNAGAYGGELGALCTCVEILDGAGNFRSLATEELAFSYRYSAVRAHNWTVVSAVFALTPGEPEAIRARMRELIARRTASQPLNYPSAGSAFKRPEGAYAAALIDGAGLKGFRVGDAAISEKHAGFAINLGSATAADVKALLAQVSARVLDATGIRLEPEICIW